MHGQGRISVPSGSARTDKNQVQNSIAIILCLIVAFTDIVSIARLQGICGFVDTNNLVPLILVITSLTCAVLSLNAFAFPLTCGVVAICIVNQWRLSGNGFD